MAAVHLRETDLKQPSLKVMASKKILTIVEFLNNLKPDIH